MNKFIFRKEYWDKLEGIDSYEKLDAIQDVINYALYEKEAESECGKLLLNYIREVLDEDREKLKVYE